MISFPFQTVLVTENQYIGFFNPAISSLYPKRYFLKDCEPGQGSQGSFVFKS